MKKPIDPNKIKNSPISIKTSLPDSDILLCLVEMLAERRYDIGHGKEQTPAGWRAVVTSCIEANISGDTILSHKSDINISSFTTSFLFTCTKAMDQNYNFNWLCSLS